MLWSTSEIWLDKTVFIIGGGPSLKGFDWGFLYSHDFKAIGCNDAYKLGSERVDICCFGDAKWFRHHKQEFLLFEGPKVTWRSECEDESDILVLKGYPMGLCLEPEKIGWNTNTGALAINLAIKLGSKKIILLGFDMKLDSDGAGNWYENQLDKQSEQIFKKFQKGFTYLAGQIKAKAPEVKVLNANPDSALDVFPKMSLEEAILS